jgi:hypothetical protein
MFTPVTATPDAPLTAKTSAVLAHTLATTMAKPTLV